MSLVDAALGMELFHLHKRDRAGINRKPEMASVCLICGSVHIDPDPNHPRRFVCRNCGFAFFRYACPACNDPIDSRDPGNGLCPTCRERRCVCGACGCPPPSG
jgi:hypothetical protein